MSVCDQSLNSVDVNPRIDRLCLGKDGMIPTLCSSTKNFLLDVPGLPQGSSMPNRLMLGYEALALQGYPVEIIDKHEQKLRAEIGSNTNTSYLSDVLFGDLAGNAFSSTVYMAVLVGVFLNIDPIVSTPHDRSEMEDVVSLMSDV